MVVVELRPLATLSCPSKKRKADLQNVEVSGLRGFFVQVARLPG
jgi:hypothetical protein